MMCVRAVDLWVSTGSSMLSIYLPLTNWLWPVPLCQPDWEPWTTARAFVFWSVHSNETSLSTENQWRVIEFFLEWTDYTIGALLRRCSTSDVSVLPENGRSVRYLLSAHQRPSGTRRHFAVPRNLRSSISLFISQFTPLAWCTMWNRPRTMVLLWCYMQCLRHPVYMRRPCNGNAMGSIASPPPGSRVHEYHTIKRHCYFWKRWHTDGRVTSV